MGKGLDFTADGATLALAERTDGKDSVGLFATDGWKPIRTFRVASTDLDDLKWSPSGEVRRASRARCRASPPCVCVLGGGGERGGASMRAASERTKRLLLVILRRFRCRFRCRRRARR